MYTMRHTRLRRLSNIEHLQEDLPLQVYRQSLQSYIDVHWHEFYEMGFVISGRGKHILNGIGYPLERGSCFLLTPADFHIIEPESETPLELFDVVFLSDMLHEDVYRLLFLDLGYYHLQFTSNEIENIQNDFERLYTEARDQKIGVGRVLIGTLERILIDLFRKSQDSVILQHVSSGPSPHQKLSMSLIYLHHHFREPLTLKNVAAQVHLSPTYFSETFHTVYGISFQHYVQDLRLRFATSLLSSTRLPISHIASASGFRTLSHFERVFKQKKDISPRQYRQKMV